MSQAAQFDADVAAVETDLPVTFTFAGKSYVGQKTPIVDKLGMADAGFEPGVDFILEVRLSQFTGNDRAPGNLDIIEIGDTEYCIKQTTPDQSGIVVTYGVQQKS